MQFHREINHEMLLDNIFVDEGISGIRLAPPALSRRHTYQVVLVEEFTRRPISETRNHSVLAANRRYAYLDPVLPTVVNQGNCLVVLLDAIYCHTSLATARRCLPDGEG
jgi:hypothetical protein